MVNLNLIWPGEKPKVFGWYHIMWFVIMIAACVLVSIFISKKDNKNKNEKLVFFIGLGLIILEIFKQIYCVVVSKYFDWNQVPLQFCSVPMYIAFVSGIIKNERIKDFLYRFLASFGTIAGLAVMIFPGSVFNTDYIVLLIHTMIWHSAMVVIGVHLIVSKGYGKSIKELFSPAILLYSLVIFALIVNVLAQGIYFGVPGNEYHGEFNLFYVSPFYECPLPILGNVIKNNVIYPVFLLAYLAVFSLGAVVVWSIIMLIRRLTKKH